MQSQISKHLETSRNCSPFPDQFPTLRHSFQDLHICFVQFATYKLAELRADMSMDPELQHLFQYVATGLLDKLQKTHSAPHKYWSFLNQLSIKEGLILKGEVS